MQDMFVPAILFLCYTRYSMAGFKWMFNSQSPFAAFHKSALIDWG